MKIACPWHLAVIACFNACTFLFASVWSAGDALSYVAKWQNTTFKIILYINIVCIMQFFDQGRLPMDAV